MYQSRWFTHLLYTLSLLLIHPTAQAFAGDHWSDTAQTLMGRENHAAVKLKNGKVLVTGGRQSDALTKNIISSAEIFDPASGKWTPTANLLRGRMNHQAALLPNGKVLISGGEVGRNSSPTVNCELFDPSTGVFKETGNLNIPRTGHRMVLLGDGRVLAVGGATELSAEIYDSSNGQWVPTRPMSAAHDQASAVLLRDGKVLVTGGAPDGKIAEIFDPSNGNWTPIKSMNADRVSHTSTLLNDGRVLVVGGNGAAGDSAEIYTPSSGNWSPTVALPATVRSHSATLLLNGNVLITGGYRDGDLSQRSTSTLIFEIQKGKWRNSPAMNHAHAQHATTLLNDGRLLVIAGGSFEGFSEIYEP